MSFSAEIVDGLKKLLRSRGISYRALATELQMSEAAVKRAFSERAFSLKRIEQICKVLQLSTADILEAAANTVALDRVMSEEQELLLASDEKLMCFFYVIAAGHSLGYAVGHYRISQNEAQRYLLALDKVRLIRLEPGNRFKVLVAQDFYWRKGGALESQYNHEIRRDFVEHNFAGAHDFEAFASGFLSEASLSTIRKRLSMLEDEVRELIRLDTKYRDQKVANITLYCGFRPWSMPMMRKYKRTGGVKPKA